MTPLHRAANNDHVNVCEYLVGQGADMNVQNEVSRDWRIKEEKEVVCDVCICMCMHYTRISTRPYIQAHRVRVGMYKYFSLWRCRRVMAACCGSKLV
jgi:Ankyrin repeat